MRLHKSSQEPPRARQPARTALGFTESNIFAGTARGEGRALRTAREGPRWPRDSRPALGARAASAAAAEFPRKSLQWSNNVGAAARPLWLSRNC